MALWVAGPRSFWTPAVGPRASTPRPSRPVPPTGLGLYASPAPQGYGFRSPRGQDLRLGGPLGLRVDVPRAMGSRSGARASGAWGFRASARCGAWPSGAADSWANGLGLRYVGRGPSGPWRSPGCRTRGSLRARISEAPAVGASGSDPGRFREPGPLAQRLRLRARARGFVDRRWTWWVDVLSGVTGCPVALARFAVRAVPDVSSLRRASVARRLWCRQCSGSGTGPPPTTPPPDKWPTRLLVRPVRGGRTGRWRWTSGRYGREVCARCDDVRPPTHRYAVARGGGVSGGAARRAGRRSDADATGSSA